MMRFTALVSIFTLCLCQNLRLVATPLAVCTERFAETQFGPIQGEYAWMDLLVPIVNFPQLPWEASFGMSMTENLNTGTLCQPDTYWVLTPRETTNRGILAVFSLATASFCMIDHYSTSNFGVDGLASLGFTASVIMTATQTSCSNTGQGILPGDFPSNAARRQAFSCTTSEHPLYYASIHADNIFNKEGGPNYYFACSLLGVHAT